MTCAKAHFISIRVMAECKYLSEEALENVEQQKTELETLQSIYSEEITVLKENTEYLVNISPRFDGTVQLLLPASDCDLPNTQEPTPTPPPLYPRSVEVTHLSPVALYVRYHSEYPSARQPDLHLSARWLDPKLTSFATTKLRELFTPDSPVVFDWVNFIQDELATHYSTHQLQIATNTPPEPTDAKCEASPELAVESKQHPCQIFLRSTSQFDDMEEFDLFESHKEFLQGKHECGICFQLVPGEEFCEPCHSCNQLFCRQCVTEYCQVYIGEGMVSHLSCPNQSCGNELPDPLLQTLLPNHLFEKYDRLRNEVQLDSVPGMVFCPRSSCGSRVVSEPDSELAMCPKCAFPFCKICKQTWHGPGTCPAMENVSSEEGGRSTDASQPKKKSKQDQRRIEELKTLIWMRSPENSKACPKCCTLIQKSGGCNKMTCRNCSSSFCWLCGKQIAGYSHFSNAGPCQLFRPQDYLPPEKRPTHDVRAPDNQELLENVLMSKCPRCEEDESKTNDNNWIHCRRCKFQFCHLCRDPCFGTWHFSKYGCQQFTNVKQDVAHFHKMNRKT